MSDLQCPVLVYVGRHGQAERPAGVSLASVYTWSARDLDDVRSALDELADRHRGEAVLLLLDEPGLEAVERWAGAGRAGGPLVLEGDTDGWRHHPRVMR